MSQVLQETIHMCVPGLATQSTTYLNRECVAERKTKSWCQQSWFPPRRVREALFQASLVASRSLRCPLAHGKLSPSVVTLPSAPVCLWVHILSLPQTFFIRIPVMLDSNIPKWLHFNLIICQVSSHTQVPRLGGTQFNSLHSPSCPVHFCLT